MDFLITISVSLHASYANIFFTQIPPSFTSFGRKGLYKFKIHLLFRYNNSIFLMLEGVIMKTKIKRIFKYILISIGILFIAVGALIYYETKNDMYGSAYPFIENKGAVFKAGERVLSDGVLYKPSNLETVIHNGKPAYRLELVVKRMDTDNKYIFDPRNLTLHDTLGTYAELVQDDKNLESVFLPYWGDEKRYVIFEIPNKDMKFLFMLEIKANSYSEDTITYSLKLDPEEDV